MLQGTAAEKATRILDQTRYDLECEAEDRSDAFDQWLGAQSWHEFGKLYEAAYSLANEDHRNDRNAGAEKKRRAQELWTEARPHLRAYWENCRASSYTGWSRESKGPVRKAGSHGNLITIEQAAVLEDLEAAQGRVNEHADELIQRDDAIRASLGSGMTVMDVVNRTGLSRERVYQIRDGRR